MHCRDANSAVATGVTNSKDDMFPIAAGRMVLVKMARWAAVKSGEVVSCDVSVMMRIAARPDTANSRLLVVGSSEICQNTQEREGRFQMKSTSALGCHLRVGVPVRLVGNHGCRLAPHILIMATNMVQCMTG